MRKQFKFQILSSLLLVYLFTFTLLAGPVNKTFIGSKAIEGYDPVAYFLQKKPVRGSKKFIYKWKGANWYFSKEKHLKLFKKNSKKYAPQYGGYCAYAVSKGYTASIDPKAWDIYKGKLYLNYDLDIQKNWRSKKDAYIKKANKNWPSLSK